MLKRPIRAARENVPLNFKFQERQVEYSLDMLDVIA